MTVAQLQQALNRAISAHKPDAEIARQIGDFELTERLTKAMLGQLKAGLVPGSQGSQALELLADRSAFLDPPASELPAASAPDNAEQIRIMESARRYVSQTLPRLPDFFATRVINLYDDRAQTLKKGEWPTRSGLHLIDTSSAEVSVRNERESQSATGLISGGEFGHTLAMILADTAKGSISWSHWEESAKGRVAVFRYEVPASASHYEVLNANPSNSRIVHTKPGYHGSIVVNPVDGTILRITIDADLTRGSPFRRAAILVEYGPVDIAGTTFICPLRSIALSRALDDPDTINGDAPNQWLNETHFTNYHRFGAKTRILAAGSAPSSAEAEPARTDVIGGSGPQLVTSGAPETQKAEGSPVGGQPPPAEPPSAPAAKMQAPQAGASQSGTGRRVEPSSTASAGPAEPVPEPPAATVPANASPTLAVAPPGNVPNSGVTLHVEVSKLLIPVVVRDKQGRVVGDLKKEDFQVLDDGKPRPISGFTVEKLEATESAPGGGAESAAQAGTPNAAPQQETLPKRITVYLFDDLHLSAEDLAYLKKLGAKALDGALVDSDMAAVVSTSGKVNSGLTRDRQKLLDAIMSLEPRSLYTSSAGDCPKIEYYEADLIENKHDDAAFAKVLAQVFACDPALNPQRDLEVAKGMVESAAKRVVMVGDQDAQVTLDAIKEFVRRTAKLPGQRTLILVSPGFVSIAPGALISESQIMDLAVQSNMTINALDARGLYTGATDISERGAGQIIDPTHLAAMTRAEGVMSELANGTGGAFFHNSNDLGAGFKSLTKAPEAVYVLELSLDGVKPDGSYHRLKVKVDRDGMQIQTRRGYPAPKQQKTRK